MEGSRLEITALLDRVRQGSTEARNELAPRVYQELHRIAKRQVHARSRRAEKRGGGMVHVGTP